MSSYLQLVYAITTRNSDKIKKLCAPLFETFNLNQFWYSKITIDGHHTFVDSHVGWCEYFASEKLYLKYDYLRHPKFIQAGIKFHKHNDVHDPHLGPILRDCSIKFDIQQSLKIINQIPDGVEEFGFASSSPSETQTSLFFNELPLLRLFAKKFVEDNRPLIRKLDENRIDLMDLIGPQFHVKKPPLIPYLEAKNSFLKIMGIQVGKTLTSRENDVIKLLIKGYSASQIAARLFISIRTAEHHVERIKEKWVCYSKAELIQKAREMEHFGYF